MATVRLTNVKKTFGSVEVIPNLTMTVPEGSFTVLVGPSGCGKSTLLRMIAGLEEVTEGTIEIDAKDVTDWEPAERGIAMVFQSYALYPHMTVEKNIGFGLRLAKRPKAEIAERVRNAADMLQLRELLHRKPRQLSGGQRQRVAIGRAIVRNPKVFLFDEPLSNLDAALRTQMRVEIAELHRKLGATIIYVTHDQVEAMTMADQIVIMNKGQFEQVGSPMRLYHEPANEFVATFIGSPKMNLINGEQAKRYGADVIGVRPEDIQLSKTNGDWRGVLRHAEHLGSDTIAYIEVDAIGPMTARAMGNIEISAGDTVFLTPNVENLHRFSNGKRTE